MNFKQTATAIKLNLKQAAPDIALVAGLALNGLAVFKFCQQSFKAAPIVEKAVKIIDDTDYLELKKENPSSEETKAARDIVLETGKNLTIDLAKIYWKPALMWTVSTGLIVKSHTVMKDRNIALATLATGLGTELRTLHERIIERYGERVDQELKQGITYEPVEIKHIDEATGSEVVDTDNIPVVREGDTGGTSIYARFFDECSKLWTNDPETNLIILKGIEKDANTRLRAQGVLFLNEVYDMLDIPRTKAGQKVGWRYYYKKEDNLYGDNYVSFNIMNVHRAANRDFVNGYQPSVLLDFNVDGAIIDALPIR